VAGITALPLISPSRVDFALLWSQATPQPALEHLIRHARAHAVPPRPALAVVS
jgi:hypothetical protein